MDILVRSTGAPPHVKRVVGVLDEVEGRAWSELLADGPQQTEFGKFIARTLHNSIGTATRSR